jgi:hypothetical protein
MLQQEGMKSLDWTAIVPQLHLRRPSARRTVHAKDIRDVVARDLEGFTIMHLAAHPMTDG